jgi:3-oxoacyl-[acyl-carrier-protein] synthase-3
MTRRLPAQRDRSLRLMLLGYGVGLSWGAAVVDLDTQAPLMHGDYTASVAKRGVIAIAGA